MVTAFVDGRSIGPALDLHQLLADYTARQVRVELRDDAGQALAELVPANAAPALSGAPICPWEPGLDQAEIQRRIAEGGMTFDAMWADIRAGAA